MSITYQDLVGTEWPDEQDKRMIMVDPSRGEDVTAIISFQDAMSRSDFASAASILESNERLVAMIFNADKWNRHEDMIIALQRIWGDNIQQYLAKLIEAAGAGASSVIFPDGESLTDKAETWDNAVPSTRKVNGKELTQDIELTASDLGAATSEQGAKADAALPANENAVSATRLQTARTIAIGGKVTGAATAFDGTENITIQTTAVDATTLNGQSASYYASAEQVSEKLDKPTYTTGTLLAENWTVVSGGYQQTINVPGVTTAANCYVTPTPAINSYDGWGAAGIRATAQGDGTVTFLCKIRPTMAIAVNIRIEVI